MEPLILTVGRERGYLALLNEAITARGRRVVAAASEAELLNALSDREVAAVVLGGALPPERSARYRELIAAHRPELPLYQHDLRDGEQAFGSLVDRAAEAVRRAGPE